MISDSTCPKDGAMRRSKEVRDPNFKQDEKGPEQEAMLTTFQRDKGSFEIISPFKEQKVSDIEE